MKKLNHLLQKRDETERGTYRRGEEVWKKLKHTSKTLKRGVITGKREEEVREFSKETERGTERGGAGTKEVQTYYFILFQREREQTAVGRQREA